MSPLKITMLLHYYARTNDYQETVERPHAYSPAVMEALEWFVSGGMLDCRFGDVTWATTARSFGCAPVGKEPLFKITEKGTAMVEHLMAVEMPVCVWVQPAERRAM